MKRTISYSIWPREIRFEKGLSAIVEFAAKHHFTPYETHTLIMIVISAFEKVTCDGVSELVEILQRTPIFDSFVCEFYFCDKKQEHSLAPQVSFDHRRVEVAVASDSVDLIDATHKFVKDTLNLRNPEAPTSPDDRPRYLHPTVFIGRHFDTVGDEYFRQMSSFLELLGFEVKQGEEYTSQAIPEKVNGRIDSQDIFLGIVSGNREQSWLIAEPAYALGKGKHVILVVENKSPYNPTILGQDLEQIRFDARHIEQAFIPLLREFRSIRVRGI